jgi:hypothetical protein
MYVEIFSGSSFDKKGRMLAIPAKAPERLLKDW